MDQNLNCIVSNKVVDENAKINFCYKEEAENEYDSGWRFFAGDEDDDYLNDPENTSIVLLKDIFKKDPSLKKLVEANTEEAGYEKIDNEWEMI